MGGIVGIDGQIHTALVQAHDMNSLGNASGDQELLTNQKDPCSPSLDRRGQNPLSLRFPGELQTLIRIHADHPFPRIRCRVQHAHPGGRLAYADGG